MASLDLEKKKKPTVDKEWKETLSPLEKFGYGLEAFGAGIQGRTPLHMRQSEAFRDQRNQEAKNKLEGEQHRLAQFKATYGMFDEAFKMVKKIPPGYRKDAIAKMKSEMNNASMGSGDTFELWAQGDDDDVFGKALQLFSDPDVAKGFMTLAGDDETKFYELLRSPDIRKMIEGNVDQDRIPSVIQKLTQIRSLPTNDIPSELRDALEKHKTEDGEYYLTDELIQAGNPHLPEELQLTPQELATISRRPEAFAGTGFIPPAKVAEINTEKIKNQNKPKDKWGKPYSMDGAMVQENLSTGKVDSVIGRPPVPSIVSTGMPPEAMIFEQEQKLRKEYDDQSKKYVDFKDYFVPVAKAYSGGKTLTPPEDLLLSYAYLHSLDPKADRITEGDFLRFRNLGSLPDRIWTGITAVLNGYNLPEDLRKEMFAVASRSFKELNKRQRSNETHYEGMATQYPGLNPARVVKKYSLDDTQPSTPSGGKKEGPSYESILEEGKKNGWSDLQIEQTIKDFHGDEGVRRYKTERVQPRKKR